MATPDAPAVTNATSAAKQPGFFIRLYTGTGAFDIVGRRKMWYVITGLLVLVCLGSMVFRQFNLGIDFVGGTRLQFPVAAADGRSIGTDGSSPTPAPLPQ